MPRPRKPPTTRRATPMRAITSGMTFEEYVARENAREGRTDTPPVFARKADEDLRVTLARCRRFIADKEQVQRLEGWARQEPRRLGLGARSVYIRALVSGFDRLQAAESADERDREAMKQGALILEYLLWATWSRDALAGRTSRSQAGANVGRKNKGGREPIVTRGDVERLEKLSQGPRSAAITEIAASLEVDPRSVSRAWKRLRRAEK